jgi:large subunit ribosomal protein LP1
LSSVQADKISAVLKAANVSVEAYWPNLFAKTLASKSLDSLITNVGAGAQTRVASQAACGSWTAWKKKGVCGARRE